MATRKACSTATPWGRADDSTQLARGINWYSTPSHGGLGVTLAWAEKNLTPHAQELGERWSGRIWYEEDCLCSVVFYEHPELERFGTTGSTRTSEEIAESNAQVIRSYFPQYFDPEFQRFCQANPVMPPIQVGDCVKFSRQTMTYGPISEVDDDGHFLVGSGWAGYVRIRRNHVMESAQVLTRAGIVVWRRASDLWAASKAA